MSIERNFREEDDSTSEVELCEVAQELEVELRGQELLDPEAQKVLSILCTAFEVSDDPGMPVVAVATIFESAMKLLDDSLET
jgi:hypothetical protein